MSVSEDSDCIGHLGRLRTFVEMYVGRSQAVLYAKAGPLPPMSIPVRTLCILALSTEVRSSKENDCHCFS